MVNNIINRSMRDLTMLLWICVAYLVYIFWQSNKIEGFKQSPQRKLPYLINALEKRKAVKETQVRPYATEFYTTQLLLVEPREKDQWNRMNSHLNAYAVNFLYGPAEDKKKMCDYFVLQLHPWAIDKFDLTKLDAKGKNLVFDIVLQMHLFGSDDSFSIEINDVKRFGEISAWLMEMMVKMEVPFGDKLVNNMENAMPIAIKGLLEIFNDDDIILVKSNFSMFNILLNSVKTADFSQVQNNAVNFLKFSQNVTGLFVALYTMKKLNLKVLSENDRMNIQVLCKKMVSMHDMYNEMHVPAYAGFSDKDIAGFLLPWVVIANSIDPTLRQDPTFEKIYQQVSKEYWCGLGGSTIFYFA